jgi:hypothetical protein
VKISESDQIVEAMEASGIPVTYVVFPDEGHGFAKPENNNAFNAVVEAFLAEHLGGRVEPMAGEIAASTAQLRNLGGLEFDGVKAWDPAAEPAPVAETTISFDALGPEQQAKIEEVLGQIESQVPEPQRPFAYPAIATQLRSQAASAPAEDRDAMLYAAQELERRATSAGTSIGTDASPEG